MSGKDLVTRQANKLISCLFLKSVWKIQWRVFRGSNESYPSECCFLSQTPTKIHLAVITSHMYMHLQTTAVTGSWLCAVLDTLGAVFCSNKSHQSPTSLCQSKLVKLCQLYLTSSASRGGLLRLWLTRDNSQKIHGRICKLKWNFLCYMHLWH